MAIKTAIRPQGDMYDDLVKEFRLVRIRDDAHLAKAQAMIDRLLRQNLDPGGEEYLDLLSDLVGDYEDEHLPIADAPPADVLRELMRANGLSQNALSKRVGIAQSTISAILTGDRSLNMAHATALAESFNLSPAVFLPTSSEEPRHQKPKNSPPLLPVSVQPRFALRSASSPGRYSMGATRKVGRGRVKKGS